MHHKTRHKSLQSLNIAFTNHLYFLITLQLQFFTITPLKILESLLLQQVLKNIITSSLVAKEIWAYYVTMTP